MSSRAGSPPTFTGDATFSVLEGEPTEHVHLAFSAPDRETVDRFHEAGIEAGYESNGEPGERPEYHAGYYGAYLFDPDGHNVEAVFHGPALRSSDSVVIRPVD